MMPEPPTPTHEPATPAAEPLRKSTWTIGQRAVRVLWALVSVTVWRVAPSHAARRSLLRAFGASVGPGVRIAPTVQIEIPWHLSIGQDSVVCERAILYCLGRVTIGDRCLVGPFAHLCAGTHDASDPEFALLREPIHIGSGSVLMTDVFVGPGVTVAPGTVARPRAGLFKNTQPGRTYAGSPARVVEQAAAS